MTTTDDRAPGADEAAFVAAVRSGDAARFALLTECHRREPQVHCYRMVANYEDAQDLTQETFLRAWKKRESVRGTSIVAVQHLPPRQRAVLILRDDLRFAMLPEAGTSVVTAQDAVDG